MPESNGYSWRDDRKLVLHELKRCNDMLVDIDNQLTQQNIEIVKLKTKSASWGAVAGAIVSVATALVAAAVTAAAQ